jgi:hypothetical protein
MGKGATRPVRETAHCFKSKPLNVKGMGRRDLDSLLMPDTISYSACLIVSQWFLGPSSVQRRSSKTGSSVGTAE